MKKVSIVTVSLLAGAFGCGGPGGSDGVDPTNLSYLLTVKSADSPRGGVGAIASTGTHLYGAFSHGMIIVELGQGADAKKVGEYNPKGADKETGVSYIVTRGSTLWFADTDGTHIMDISSPIAPTELRVLKYFGASAMRSAAAGHKFAVDEVTSTLWDMADPTNPTDLGRIITTGNPHSTLVEGNTIYLAREGLVELWDITDPVARKLTGSIDGVCGELFQAAPGIVYCSVGESGNIKHAILDARDPKALAWKTLPDMTTLPTQNTNWSGAANMTHIGARYLLCQSNYRSTTPGYPEATRVYDLSNPLVPMHLPSMASAMPEMSADFFAADARFVFVSHSSGVSLFSN